MSKKTKAPAKKASAPKAKVASKTETKPDTTPARAAPKDQRNGITRPGEGTACRAIWDLLDKLKADGKDLAFATLRAGIDPKVADATVRTQKQRWAHYAT